MVRLIIAWFGCLALLSLSSASAQPSAKPGGTLIFAVDSELANYDCHANISFAFIHPVAPHYSTLLKFDAANYPRVKGDLAESWTVSPDKRTYTFKLRPNVLFHDGTRLTSADVAASYERIIRPPAGVSSPRQVDYASISAIETPDPQTVIFKLQWPDAAMLANFASPWNCIYSKVRLDADPQFPRANVMGTGPFTFVRHEKGKQWIGRRWEKYFLPGRPYLDGYQAEFMSGARVVKGMTSGHIMATFRSFTPVERNELEKSLGNRITIHESPWIINLLLVFNTKQPPFDDVRVRRALSLAIDRWGLAESLSDTTFLKFVGGLMRPGFVMATPEAALSELPGFSRNIVASREQARRLLAEAGKSDLRLTLVNRDIPVPYGPGADALIEAWRAIGVTAEQVKLNTRDWQSSLENGRFAVALDFIGDYFDDPTLQMAKYVSRDLSPSNYSNATDRVLDALYVGQAISVDPRERSAIIRDFERRAMTEANVVPLLWWNRIVVTSSRLKGWVMTPSHYIGQDLTDVWIDR